MINREYIGFNKELGHKIVETSNCHWIIKENNYALSFPTLETVFPTHEDLQSIFKHKIKFLLFKTDIGLHNSAEYVFKGSSYGMEMFDSKIRNQVKKGLKTCAIRDVDLELIKKRGFEINRQTLMTHNRNVSYLGNKLEWENYITKHYYQSDIFIKGAYVQKILVAYIIFIKVENRYVIFHPFMDRSYSSSNPMNALLYSFINEIISKEGEILISYGLASFSEKPGLDKFKKGMLFSEVPVARVVVVNPLFKVFVNPLIKLMLQSLVRVGLVNSHKLDILNYLIKSKEVQDAYDDYLKISQKK